MDERSTRKPLTAERFRLRPLAPFRLDYTAWALRRRPGNIIDRWDGKSWRRILSGNEGIAEVQITQTGTAEKPSLSVRVIGEQRPLPSRQKIKVLLTRLLGLETDLSDFLRLVRGHKTMGPLAERFRGVRLPRFPSVFEALVNGIACQQLSLTVGITLLNRLAESFGDRFEAPDGLFFSFPRPQRLACANAADLRRLGFSHQKAEALVALSREAEEKTIDLEGLGSLGNDEARDSLLQLKGVGRWTADYTLLRGLGRVAVFPSGDVGARNRLQALLRVRKPLHDKEIRRHLRKWSAFAGVIYIHLLLSGLEEDGCL